MKSLWREKVKRFFSVDLLLVVLLSFVLTLSITWDSHGEFNLILFLVTFGLVLLILCLMWKWLIKTKVGKKEPGEIRKCEFLVYGGITIFISAIAIIARYPAADAVDANTQLNQVLSGKYSNWHPVFHTLFVFALPQLLFHNILATTIFQCLLIFLALMYFCYFCRKNFLNFWQTFFVLLLIILNPTFTNYSVWPIKDVLYSWALFMSTLLLINIVRSKGEWLASRWHKIFFILMTLGVLLFRHNGLVPFVLIYITLAFGYAKFRKFILISLGTILVSFFIITGPIFRAMGVGGTGGSAEMMGVMMGQISHYYHYRETEFSEEELAVLNDVTPLQNWKDNYDPASYDFIKYAHRDYVDNGETTTNAGIERNSGKLIGIWWNKSMSNPKSFIESYLNMTSPIWQSYRGMREIDLSIDEEQNYVQKGEMLAISNRIEQNVIDYNKYMATSQIFRILFVDVGEGLMVILFALVLIFRKRRGEGWQPLIPFLGVLASTATIMIMITGGEVRFVYAQIICAMPLLIYGLSDITGCMMKRDRAKIKRKKFKKERRHEKSIA